MTDATQPSPDAPAVSLYEEPSPPPTEEQVQHALAQPTPLQQEQQRMVSKAQHDKSLWEERQAREVVEEQLIKANEQLAYVANAFKTVTAENEAFRRGRQMPQRGDRGLEEYLNSDHASDWDNLRNRIAQEAVSAHVNQQTAGYRQAEADARKKSVSDALRVRHPDAGKIVKDDRFGPFLRAEGHSQDQIDTWLNAPEEGRVDAVRNLSAILAEFKVQNHIAASSPSAAPSAPAASSPPTARAPTIADVPRMMPSSAANPSTQTPRRFTHAEWQRITRPNQIMKNQDLYNQYKAHIDAGGILE